MTKKKIRYSEFAPPAAEARPAEAAPRPRAPLDLARALAAAREAEQAAAVIASPTPAAPPASDAAPAPRAVSGRLTPVRGSVAIPRLTPVRGSVVQSRPTPGRGAIAIVRDAAPASPSAPARGGWANAPSASLRERARLRAGTVELLLFSVGQEWFGIELAVVEEAIDLPSVRHVPEMPPAMLGVITVRGSLTALYSPASALGVPLGERASALVFRRERGRLAIAVDDVDDVHTLDLAQLREPPAADAGDGLLLGVLRHRETLLALVDAEALIAACQIVPAMETA